MLHPHTRLGFISESIGCGVLATEFIPKGTITWVLDELDLKLDEAYVNSLDELLKNRFKEWDLKIMDAMRYINHVEQPLKHLINRKLIDKINAVTEGREQMDSIISLYQDLRKNCHKL